LQTNTRPNLLKVAWTVFALWAVVMLAVPFCLSVFAEPGSPFDTHLIDRDFANYWVGGRSALDGRFLLLFDQKTYFPLLKTVFGADYPLHNWGYPPHFLLLCVPLGLLSYGWAMFAFLGLTFVLFAFAAEVFRRQYAGQTSPGMLWLAVSGYVFLMLQIAQNGFLTGALLLLTFAFMHRRTWVAGLALALLTTKPQLGFLVPLLALLDRNWGLLRWATIFTIALIALSIAVFGVESWRAYFELTIPYQNYVMHGWYGGFLSMMPTTFGALRSLEYSPGTSFAVQWIVSALAFALLLRLVWTFRDPLDRICAVAVGTLLVTPYAFNYDMGAVSVIAAIMALRAHETRDPAMTIAFGALAVLPAAVAKLGLAGYPVAPLMIAAAFVTLWLRRTPLRNEPAA